MVFRKISVSLNAPQSLERRVILVEAFQICMREFWFLALISLISPSLDLMGTWLGFGTPETIRTWNIADWMFFFAKFIPAWLASALMIAVALQDLKGEKIGLRLPLRMVLSTIVALIIASSISTLAFLIGFLALVIPGIMISCALCVAVPVCLTKKCSGINSLKQSMNLTIGKRWLIFLVFLWVYSRQILLNLDVIIYIMSLFKIKIAIISENVYLKFINAVTQSVFYAFSMVCTAVVYIALCRSEGQPGPSKNGG